jgi:hypothetical protein
MTNVATSQLINLVCGQILDTPPANIAQQRQPHWSAGNRLKYLGIPAWILAICASILLHLMFLVNFQSSARFERQFVFQDTILASQRWELVNAPHQEPARNATAIPASARSRPLEPTERPASQPVDHPVLAISGDIANSVGKSYLKLNEVQIPAEPQVSWLLPFKYNYFAAVRSLEFQIWIDADGSVPSVHLFAVGPVTLSPSEMQTVVDWIRSTVMVPALNDGSPVPSTRVIEVVLDSTTQ